MNDACETCLRWPECNGVDADTCLIRRVNNEKEAEAK